MATEPFNVPDLKDSVGFRLSKEDKQNLRLLMAQWQDGNVSAVIKRCVEQQAAPVRQQWQEAADRRAKGARDG